MDNDCLANATANNIEGCKSGKTCLTKGMCLDNPICRAIMSIGKNAGFVEPTSSACQCGYGEGSFGGFICYCPTRWLVERRKPHDAGKSPDGR